MTGAHAGPTKSALRPRIGRERKPTPLSRGDWADALRDPLMEAGEMARLRKATRTGRPLGSEDFVTELETRLERPLKLRKTGPAKKTRAAAAR